MNRLICYTVFIYIYNNNYIIYMNITLVTGYYNLSKYEKRYTTNELYLKWGEFILKLDLNIVFFVEKDTYMYIWVKRKEYNLLNKTLIIIREMCELQYYDKYKLFNEYLLKKKMSNAVTNRDSVYYYLLTWNKFFMVNDVIQINPFKTTHFGWIDFGAHHILNQESIYNSVSYVSNLFNECQDKIKILSVHTMFKNEFTDINDYTSTNKYKLAAGLWTGNRNNILSLTMLFRQELDNLLYNKTVVNEETILSIVYIKNQELFNLYYGYYNKIFENYLELNICDDYVLAYIASCRVNNDTRNAYDIAKSCVSLSNLSPLSTLRICDELIVNGFYVDKSNISQYCDKMINLLLTNEDANMKDYYIKNKQRILTNISFLENKNELLNKISTISWDS